MTPKTVKQTNVCFYTDLDLSTNTGATDRIINFSKALARKGLNVYIIDRFATQSLSNLLNDPDTYYKVINGKIVKQLYPRVRSYLFPGLLKVLQEFANRFFCVITGVPIGEVTISRIIDPCIIAKLLFVCRKESINIVICEHTPTAAISTNLAKKVLKIPVIYDAHNVETERLKNSESAYGFYASILRKIENEAFKKSDFIFAVSKNDVNKIVNFGIASKKITIIPNSVDITQFSPLNNGNKVRADYNLQNKFVIFFHGTLDYNPNSQAVNLLIRDIMPQIVKHHPASRLLLVGSGRPEFLSSKCLFAGYVDNLETHIAAADLAVVPLLRGGGTRIKILEYMASGKAVVSTKKGAEGLEVENGVNIILTDQPDDEFVAAIRLLINNPERRKVIGKNARKTVELLYNWNINAEKAIEVFNRISR